MLNYFYPITADFDKLFEDFTNELTKSSTNYPPYNIGTIQKEDTKYGLIEIAVTGLTEKDVKVYFDDEGLLTIEGKYPKIETEINYNFKSLSSKDFTRKFKLEKNYTVKAVQLENGLLRIFLKEDKPEIQTIPINTEKVKLIA